MNLHNKRNHEKKISRRFAIFMGLQGVSFSVLASRYFYLQIINKEKYQLRSDNNRIDFKVLIALRGEIYDHKGKLLASNLPTFSLTMVPTLINNRDDFYNMLVELLQCTDDEKELLYKNIMEAKGNNSVYIYENMSWKQVSRTNLEIYRIPGLNIENTISRHYPYDKSFSHLIGYVATPSPENFNRLPQHLRRLYRQPGFLLGKIGMEKYYNDTLQGETGVLQVEVNAHGKQIRKLDLDPPKKGNPVKLTLDATIQTNVMKLLGEHKAGALVAIEIETGAIRVMASVPSYASLDFLKGISTNNWNKLRNDPLKPMVHRAIAGQYSPGSIYKIVSALAILKSGIDISKPVNCVGVTELYGHKYHCWKKHGKMDFHSAISQSCDTWFYHMAKQCGVDAIAEMAQILGLGKNYNLPFDEEKSGIIPSTKWKRKALQEPWYLGETLHASIGQGYVLTTPLQLSVMMANFASGKKVKPYLDFNLANSHNGFEDLDIPKHFLDEVKMALVNVINHPKGTAYHYRKKLDYLIAGKSGTSQVRSISLQERESDEEIEHPWHLRDHALFAAYAPSVKPKYAVACIVEHGKGGSSVAFPIVQETIRMLMKDMA